MSDFNTINQEGMTLDAARNEIEKIRDEDVKNFLFDIDWEERTFLTQPSQIYSYFNNVIIISFMYLYGKYLTWKKQKPNALKENAKLSRSSNFMRIITTFEKLYSSFNLSYELIENILSDIQIMFNSENNSVYTKELGIEGDFATISDFSSCLDICRSGRTIRGQDNDKAYLRKKLIDFLSMAPFLTNIDIEHSPFMYNDQELHIVSSKTNSVINFERLNVRKMNKIDDNFEMNTSYAFLANKPAYFYLSAIEDKIAYTENNEKRKYLVLSYNTVGSFTGDCGEKVYIVIRDHDDFEIEIENYYYADALIDPDSFRAKYFGAKKATSISHFIKDFNAINYRYIRILSLAISDILNDDSKTRIYNTYSKREEYKSMFIKDAETADDLLNNYGQEEKGYGWDVVIAVILIGESAKKFLFGLFEGHANRFEQLLTNLEYRFGRDRINKDALIEQSRQELIAAKEKNFREAYGRKKVSFRSETVDEGRIKAKIQAAIIVQELSKLTFSNENESNKTAYPLSIKSRLKIISEIANGEVGSQDEKAEAMKKLVCQTLKTMYVFYHGLFAYGAVKMNFESMSSCNIFEKNVVARYISSAVEAFKNKAEEAATELQEVKDNDVRTMVLKLKQFNKQCSYPGQTDPYSEILHQLLGRDYLLEYRAIAGLENCFERYESNDPDFDFGDLANKVRKAMDYLRTGEADSRLGSSSGYAIFPLVVFMDYTSKTRDGYDIYHCSLSSSDSDREADYRVISEFDYPVNVSYYCIPNIARSNEDMKLWIEPILIDANLVQEVDFGYKEDAN